MDYTLFNEEYKQFTLHDAPIESYETALLFHFSNLGYYFSIKHDKVADWQYHSQLACIVAKMYEPEQVKLVSDIAKILLGDI
jgi:hypothetical protein